MLYHNLPIVDFVKRVLVTFCIQRIIIYGQCLYV